MNHAPQMVLFISNRFVALVDRFRAEDRAEPPRSSADRGWSGRHSGAGTL